MAYKAKPIEPKRPTPGAGPHTHAYDLLTSTSNKVSRGASRAFISKFGVGLVEWRILRLLQAGGETAANKVSSILELDKAAVSRSLALLEQRGCISRSTDRNDARRRLLGLTAGGASLQRRMAKVAEARAHGVFKGFAEDDEATLIGLLQRLYQNAAELNQADEAGAGARIN